MVFFSRMACPYNKVSTNLSHLLVKRTRVNNDKMFIFKFIFRCPEADNNKPAEDRVLPVFVVVATKFRSNINMKPMLEFSLSSDGQLNRWTDLSIYIFKRFSANITTMKYTNSDHLILEVSWLEMNMKFLSRLSFKRINIIRISPIFSHDTAKWDYKWILVLEKDICLQVWYIVQQCCNEALKILGRRLQILFGKI